MGIGLTRFERNILNDARHAAKNPKLKYDDIQQWSTSEDVVRKNAREDEVVLYGVFTQVWFAIKADVNKRPIPQGSGDKPDKG